ncbi:TIGR03668 family PPOX class F420-dependent oxidoreductase [Sphaerisporangium dianthi]|uniref:TIGR03668 family PPOX class F420-dependent oxidoreductase n=1 Tax=Sphaerisporangium dianthi TaxID=1436120 RepID=A0ABV9CDG0_9ACTN
MGKVEIGSDGPGADWARARMAGARVARLATVGDDGRPHLVPVTFSLDGDRVVTAVDHKPKSGTRLRRLRNVQVNPNVCVLVDHYDDDWTTLWWVRADGFATVVERGDERIPELLTPLVMKYPQYRDRVPEGPVVVIEVTRYSGWSSLAVPDVTE